MMVLLIRRRVPASSPGNKQLAIGQERVAATEQIIQRDGRCNSLDLPRLRIPDAGVIKTTVVDGAQRGVIKVLRAAEIQNLPLG
jgi:hypothetical protein